MKIKQEIKKWKNFAIASIVLAIFFVLEYFHEWANSLLVKLHFCNHTYCMIFAAIFIVIAFFAWKNKKHYLKSALIILGVGLILMNVTYCENGSMFLGDFSFGAFSIISSDSDDDCKPGVDCPGDVVEVPIPPCIETDDGRDYITPGMILSGADIEDMCMGDDILRERYCDSELTYTSEDVSCSDLYGEDWICEDRECILSETPVTPPDGELEACYTACENEAIDYCNEHTLGEGSDEYDYCMASLANDILECKTICDEGEPAKENTLALCTDEIDNDGDGAIDCADFDCAEFCECVHDCDPLTGCFGYCDDGYYCDIYNVLGARWCECIRDGREPCGEVDGWCLDEDICVPTPDGDYICVYDFGYLCYESDGGDVPLVGGYCYDFATETFVYDECEEGYPIVMEMTCFFDGCRTGQGWCEDWGYGCVIDSKGEGDYCEEVLP